MALQRYSISPVAHGLSTSAPQLYTDRGFSPSPVNGRIEQGSFRKRWGYSLDRTLTSAVYEIVLYSMLSGTRHTLYLTATDLCKREAAGTWSYLTETSTTPVVTGMNGAKTIVTFSGGGITASGVDVGDKFIIDADHSATAEPDVHWATVLTKDSDTQITLSAAYAGAATTGSCKLRKIFSVPANERWSWAIVSDKFCFGNGDTNVMYWAGSGYATSLDSTNAVKARYMCEYGDRLFLADMYLSGIRQPTTVKWCKFGDPTNWTDATAGENPFVGTEDYLSGIGQCGSSLAVFKRESYYVGSRTGSNTTPFTFPTFRQGVGSVAPASIAPCLDALVWRGRDDFYAMSGDIATPIGEPVRGDFLDHVTVKEQERMWVHSNRDINEVLWTVNTDMGKRTYVWNYKKNEWYIYVWVNDITAGGRGAL